VTVLWNQGVHTDREVRANRPDIIIKNKKEKTCILIYVAIGKGKAVPYRPWQALRAPGDRGSQVFRQSVHEGGKVVSPMHRPPLPPRKDSWY
jgi:hypothetical protein